VDELIAEHGKQCDPDECMNPGRTVERYQVDGKTCIRTIGASWQGEPDKPTANTSVPVRVFDSAFRQPQDLHVNEAELFFGLKKDATAGSGVSAKERLRAIG
jgi:hypothetical protein